MRYLQGVESHPVIVNFSPIDCPCPTYEFNQARIAASIAREFELREPVCWCRTRFLSITVSGRWDLGELKDLELKACCIKRLTAATDGLALRTSYQSSAA